MAIPAPTYPNGDTPGEVYLAAVASVALLALTARVVIRAWAARRPGSIVVLGGVWVVAPPVWFWYEYFFLYLARGNAAAFEQFKYGQQVSVAIWAGVVLFLFALVSNDRFKTGPDQRPAGT